MGRGAQLVDGQFSQVRFSSPCFTIANSRFGCDLHSYIRKLSGTQRRCRLDRDDGQCHTGGVVFPTPDWPRRLDEHGRTRQIRPANKLPDPRCHYNGNITPQPYAGPHQHVHVLTGTCSDHCGRDLHARNPNPIPVHIHTLCPLRGIPFIPSTIEAKLPFFLRNGNEVRLRTFW